MKLSYSKDLVDHALFRGIEAEGPLAGVPTLFIVGDLDPKEILEHARIIQDELNGHAVSLYFGAAGWLTYNKQAVVDCLTQSTFWVTVEAPDPDLDMLKKYPKLFWMFPQCWHSKTMETSAITLKEILLKAKNDPKLSACMPRLTVKYDYGDFVHTVQASKVGLALRDNYMDDVELKRVNK